MQTDRVVFVQSSVDGHVGCSRVSAVGSDAAIKHSCPNVCSISGFPFLLLAVYPELEVLGHVAKVCLIF